MTADELRAEAVRLLVAIPDAEDRVALVAAALDRHGRQVAAEELRAAAGGVLKMSRPTDEWVHDFLRSRAAALTDHEEAEQ